jgi:hypothetical protein
VGGGGAGGGAAGEREGERERERERERGCERRKRRKEKQVHTNMITWSICDSSFVETHRAGCTNRRRRGTGTRQTHQQLFLLTFSAFLVGLCKCVKVKV